MSTASGAGELIAGALLDGIDHLDPATTADLLATYGITVPPTRYVAIGEALEAAIEVGFPVAVKARHRNVGRSVRAGVALDLVDAPAIAAAIDVMRAELGDHADYVIVQAMTPPGLDLRIRATLDDEAGPLMSVGIGGFQAGLLDDPEAAPSGAAVRAERDEPRHRVAGGTGLDPVRHRPGCARRPADADGPIRR